MANMSYCRFENTYPDLNDCYKALLNAGSIKNLEEKSNEYEKRYVRMLVDLCKEIVNDFGDDDENDFED